MGLRLKNKAEKPRSKKVDVTRENNGLDGGNPTEKSEKEKGRERKISYSPNSPRNDEKNEKFPPLSSVTLEVETVTPTALINKLTARTVLSAPEYSGGKLMFSVPSKDCAKIIALLDELCYNYKIKWIKGVFTYLFSVLRRVGIIVGTVAVVVACVLYSFLIVEIEGDYSSEVGEVLASHGIVEGRFLTSLDEDAIVREIRSLDGVSFASIERVGTRVRVHVRYEQDEKPFAVSRAEIRAIASSVITRIIVFGGTAEVEVGDEVNAGDVLVGGYYLAGDEKVPTTPSGEVYGRKIRTKTRFFADTYMVSEKVEEKSYTRLGFFGKVPKTPTSPYENFTVRYEREKNDFLVPYVIHRWTYSKIETAEKENALSEDEMKNEVYSSLVEELVGGKILSREDKIERTDGGYVVSVTVVTEERIDI